MINMIIRSCNLVNLGQTSLYIHGFTIMFYIFITHLLISCTSGNLKLTKTDQNQTQGKSGSRLRQVHCDQKYLRYVNLDRLCFNRFGLKWLQVIYILYNRELISEPQKMCMFLIQSKMPENVQNWTLMVAVYRNFIIKFICKWHQILE